MAGRIACVIDTFDERGELPANYVILRDDGLYEARVWDVANACELTLGTCNNLGEATVLVWSWADQMAWLVRWFPGPSEYLRPN
jgi:hypothetical protein